MMFFISVKNFKDIRFDIYIQLAKYNLDCTAESSELTWSHKIPPLYTHNAGDSARNISAHFINCPNCHYSSGKAILILEFIFLERNYSIGEIEIAILVNLNKL